MWWASRLKNWLVKNWHWPVVFILAGAFFVAAGAFNYFSQNDGFVKWLSPDETANYFFAKQLAETGQPLAWEKYNPLLDGIIAPRSVISDGSTLKPVSFLGIIVLYGALAKFFSPAVLPYLTPLLAALGLIFYYLLIRKLFGKNVGFIAVLLLAFFPVYFYYSARSMFHNVPFVVFLIIGFYFAVLAGERRVIEGLRQRWLPWLDSAAAGLFIGLAATIRTSELIWLAPLLLLAWLLNIARWGWFKPLLFVYFFLVAWLPVFYFNNLLYGSPVASGYPRLNGSVAVIAATGGTLLQETAAARFGQARDLLKKIYDNFFVFGFHPRQSWRMFDYYVRQMFPWLPFLAGAGLIIFCLQFWKRKKSDLVYLLSFMIVGAALVLYYGSWTFFDNPNTASHTIGNSYTRYWLPLYLGALPFAALAIVKLSKLLEFKRLTVLAQIAGALIIGGWSLTFTLYGSEEGLLPSFYRQRAARAEFHQVMRVTPPQAVIITRYHDKLFFPERKVVVGLFDDPAMNLRYARLAKRLPLYYYNFSLTPTDQDYLNSHTLAAVGLRLDLVKRVTADFSLYSLKLMPNKKALK